MTVAARVEIEMQIVASEFTVNQFDATQLNDAVSAFSRKTCGFGV
jgi:hypothetical protein